MKTAKEDLDAVLERLNSTSSDPKWLTESLIEIRKKMDEDDPSNFLEASHRDMATFAALTGLCQGATRTLLDARFSRTHRLGTAKAIVTWSHLIGRHSEQLNLEDLEAKKTPETDDDDTLADEPVDGPQDA